MGSYVGEFERRSRRLPRGRGPHVVAVSTGHAALHLALLLAGVGPGDEVITPSFNNIADFQAILATGATAGLLRHRRRLALHRPGQGGGLVAPRTKAIIVDGLRLLSLRSRPGGGACAEAQRLRVSTTRRIRSDRGTTAGTVGSFSDITMFSFDPVKTITCIDGGALVVRTEDEAQALREMRLIGMGQPSSVMYQNQRAWTYDVKRLGFRYHMANLHAALGLSQIGKIESSAARAATPADATTSASPASRACVTPQTDFDDITPFLYYIRVPSRIARDAFRAHLADAASTRASTGSPATGSRCCKDCRRGDLSVTDRVGHEIVSLPLHSRMAPETVDRVCDAIAAFFR